MAKNLNSVSFTVLLLVLVVASTGFLKSKAVPCGTHPCASYDIKEFLGQCGPVPFRGTDLDCCNCCRGLYTSPPLCWAIVEGTNREFCHCYKKY